MAKSQSDWLVDLQTAYPFGCNSGVAPLLLDKGQAAWSINTTFRGGYATDRPPVVKRTLNFGGNAELETAIRNGFFQGAGVYRPDFGLSQIIASISGRLFTFTEIGTSWTVVEITIPGDPNSATQSQVWMWQAEKWMIISDGSGALPIFYDGVSSRRSSGPSSVIASVQSVDLATPPAIGSSIVVTIAAPYTGLYNVPVYFNGALYQPVYVPPAPPPSYDDSQYYAVAVKVSCYPGGSGLVVGSQFIVKPSYVGTISSITPVGGNVQITFCPGTTNIPIGATLTVTGKGSFGVGLTINGTVIQIPSGQAASLGLVVGDFVFIGSSSDPNVPLGSYLGDAEILTGIAGSVLVDWNFAGPNGQIAWINDIPYELSIFVPPSAPGNTLSLINLTDTSVSAYGTAPYTFPASIISVPEIPACRMGCYGLGQSWFSSVDGLSFGPSDAVGSSSGTSALNYRDAVLRTTDLSVMGMFPIPNAGEIITAMIFSANLDAALGQGALMIGTATGIFSVRAPFTLIDFQALSDPSATPILTKSLIGSGPVGQNSTVLANSDIIFRSFEGVGSLILARRDFSDIAGNVPISREVSRAIDADRKDLLSFSSAIVFDNRLRMTAAPQVSAQGVFHLGEVTLNYDLVSSLRGKAAPVWEGLWTGINIFQHVQGLFGTTSRAFAFTFNLTAAQIELYELLPTGDVHFDNGATRIIWVVETPVFFNAQVKTLSDLARLLDGEMYMSDANGTVQVVVLYRPLFYPCWRPWHTFSVCADMSASNAKQQAISPLGFGEPNPRDCDPINNRPFRESNGFQVRLEITGHCKIWGLKALANQVPQPAFEKPAGTCTNAAPVCNALNCDAPNDYELYSLDGIPPAPLPPAPVPPPLQYTNDAVYFDVDCAEGTTLTFTP